MMLVLRRLLQRSIAQDRRVSRVYLYVFGTVLLCIGGILGSTGFIGRVFADTQATVTKETDTHFDQGSNSSTQVTGTGSSAYVELAGTSGPDGTLYKQEVTIDNTGTASVLTDYQVKLSIDTATLIGAGKMESSCSDMRFLDSDDSTELSYWLHGPCNDAETTVWVKVPSIPASSNDTIYFYYGGAGASESDGESVFILFDDFDDGTIDSGKWVEVDQAGGDEITESGGKLKFTRLSNDAWDKTVYAQTPLARSDISFEADYEWTNNNAGYDALMFGWHDNTAGTSYTNLVYAFYNPGTGAASTISHSVYEDGSSRGSGTGSWTVNTDYDVRVRMRNSGGAYYEYSTDSGDTWLTSKTSTYSTESNLRPGWAFYAGSHEYDNARVRQWLTTEPTASFGSESVVLPAAGTWTSPSDSNVIDLAWNGGWGDGSSGSSTAFSASVANVTSNATITFSMRTASSAGGLSSANYQTIGVANTGSSFSIDKDTMDALGLDTGTDGRYVQVRAAFAQTDGNNPQLDDFVISYLADDTAPSSNASSVAMNVTNGGASVSSNDWVGNAAPYFSWTAGADSQSGVRGYCLYLGTDSGGDPSTSKGLLGTSPESTTGTTCQFIVNATNIDFATTSYRGSPWITSSTSSYYLNIKAVDAANNVFSGSSAQFQFRYDDTVPTNPSFVSVPGDFVSSKAVTLTWPTSGGDSAADSHSGIAGLQYRINSDGTWYGDTHNGAEDSTDLLSNDGSYTTIETPDYASIDEGNNLIYIRTWDTAGNVSTSYTTAALKVNTTAPSSPQNIAVSPSSATTNAYAFSWDAPSTYTGQESNITYCYTVNTAPSSTTCSFTSGGQTSLSEGAYATQPGENTFYLVAKDEAGNVNYDVYASIEFTYTGSAPGIPTNADVADISVKATENWKLTVSWEEPTDVGAGIASYKVYRSTSDASCSSSFGSFSELGSTSGTAYSDTGLLQQNYYYCVKACDSANSCSAASTTVLGYPDGKFTEPPSITSEPVVSTITTKKGTVTWSTDRTADSKVAYGTSCGSFFDEEPSNSTHTTSHTIVLNNLDPGTEYCLTAKSTDEDGNTAVSEEVTFNTLPAPTVSEASVSDISISSAIISFTSKNAVKANIYYGPTTTFGGLVELSTSTSETKQTLLLSGLADDTKYFYKINTFDAEGDEYEGDINSFTTLPRPRITNVRVQEVNRAVNPTVLVTWDTNTDVSSIITVYPEGNPAAARDVVNVARVSGEHKMVVEGLSTNTNYILLVKGRDLVGNEAVSDSQRFTTATDTRPPQINDLTVEGSSNTTGDTSTVQLIVSWNTDEPSTSQVEFGEGSGTSYAQKTQKDSNLAFNHVVILSGLTPSKVYHLRAISTDSAGNDGFSIDTVTIAPRATDDALNLVLSNLQEAFGFIQIAR